MADNDKIDDLIKEIAVKHGVALGRNDPILILQTLHEKLIEESRHNQEQLIDELKSSLESTIQAWDASAISIAERTINASLNASREQMEASMKDITTTVSEKINSGIEKTIYDSITPIIKQTSFISKINLVASGFVVFSAILVLWASF